MPLAEKIRDKVDSGALPSRQGAKVWGGYGNGRPCDACDQPILPIEVQYDFDVPGHSTVRFHAVRCYGLWVAELLRRGISLTE